MNRHKARIEAMKALAGVGESAQSKGVNVNYTGLVAGFDKIGRRFGEMETAIKRFRRSTRFDG